MVVCEALQVSALEVTGWTAISQQTIPCSTHRSETSGIEAASGRHISANRRDGLERGKNRDKAQCSPTLTRDPADMVDEKSWDAIPVGRLMRQR